MISGIVIDHETDRPTVPDSSIMAAYDELQTEPRQIVNGWLKDKLKKAYPIPVRQFNGKL